jgi:hypothetical protein
MMSASFILGSIAGLASEKVAGMLGWKKVIKEINKSHPLRGGFFIDWRNLYLQFDH